MRIDLMAIDPGKSTGIVIVRGSLEGGAEITRAGTISGGYKEFLRVWNAYVVDKVILESFTSTALSFGDQLNTVKLIGAIELLCLMKDIGLIRQIPAVKEGYIKEAKKALKAYKHHCTPHTYDAAAHAIRYLYMAECTKIKLADNFEIIS